jgi:hypothetical protein
MGVQSILFAALEARIAVENGGKLIKECREVDFARKDVKDEDVAKQLWESSDKLIEKVEKEAALQRARMKTEQEQREKEAKEVEKAQEIDSLVQAIKKGKEKEKEKEKEVKKPRNRKKAKTNEKNAL